MKKGGRFNVDIIILKTECATKTVVDRVKEINKRRIGTLYGTSIGRLISETTDNKRIFKKKYPSIKKSSV